VIFERPAPRITQPPRPTGPVGRPDIIWGLPGTGGLLSEWAETVPDLMWPENIRTFGRMRHDSKLKAILSAYFLPLLRAHWAVDPEGIDRAEAVELVASDLGLPILGETARPAAAAIPMFNWFTHLRIALLQCVYGYMPFERWYRLAGGRTRLAGVQERMPHTIVIIDMDEQGVIQQVEQNTQVRPIEASRLLWYVHQREGANWAGLSLLRDCYTPWVLKHETMRVHATAIRRFGMGVPSVTAPPGATPAQVTQAQQMAAGMRAGDQSGAGLPAGFEYKLTGLTGSVPDALGFLEWLNQELIGSALAGILDLGTTKVGSRALGESFLDLFLLALQAEADAIGANVTYGEPNMPGLAKALVELNWGEGEPVPRIVAPDVGDRHEITALALNQLVTSGALVPDPELDGFIREMYGIPPRSAAYPVPAAPPPAPPVGGPAGGEPAPAGNPPGPAPAQVHARLTAAAATRAARARRAAEIRAAVKYRDMTPVEVAAGWDPETHQQQWASAVDQLLTAWRPVLDAQRAALVKQVAAAVAAGRPDRLASLKVDTSDGADLLAAAMKAVTTRAVTEAIAEAAHQHVAIDRAAVKPPGPWLGRVAKARAAVAGAWLAGQAAQFALHVAAPVKASAPGDAAGQFVAVKLDGLSDASLTAQLGAALTAAQNQGRMAAFAAAPDDAGPVQYVATELLDDTTCGPCKDVDGTTFGSQDEAEAAYANGGYVDCAGGERCRGTVMALWGDPAVSSLG
jgi:hypothetical protein